MHYDYMPFGKHKGEDLDDIPTDYFQWVLREDAGSWEEGLHDCIREILISRGVNPQGARPKPEEEEKEAPRKAEPPPARPRTGSVKREFVGMVVAAGRAALARKFHPDICKEPDALEKMQDINAAADWLEKCKDAIR